ncbi:MAG TPA: glycosyltransferase family 39 protein [Thermomicrobiales bacterium]|nr:glycosyltransferase family 39 protein [Thermomicrobiales bacterium]
MKIANRSIAPPRAQPRPTPRAPRGPVVIRSPSARAARLADDLPEAVRRFGWIGLVIAIYLGSALYVPVMTNALVGDDWVYVRAVEHLLQTGNLHILDLAVVTLVFQVFWGALFAGLFGLSFGVLRLSTLAITAIGGIAVYGTCRELGVRRGESALGAAAYLFTPLQYVLAFTFMTDPHFTAVMMVATWAHARALRPDRPSPRLLWAASVASAAAFLVRQQGALIPPAVLLALLLSRRIRFDRAGFRMALRVALVPAIAIVIYYLWLFRVNGVPGQQEAFTVKILTAGLGGTLLLVGRMLFISAIYLGFLALPVVVVALGRLGPLFRSLSRAAWVGAIVWGAILVAGIAHFLAIGFNPPPMPLMPYIPQYVGPGYLGPTDVRGGRTWLVPGWGALGWLTALCAVASLVFALVLLRKIEPSRQPDPTRFVAGMALAIGAGQVVGVLPPSFHFRNWIVSVDRYLLPLLPLALCLGLWGLRGLGARPFAGWLVVAAFAAYAVVGTHDFLSLQGATWDLARDAVAMGVPIDKLDAGASWDGYYLYEYSIDHHIRTRTRDGPWWTDLFGPATDSTYIVSTEPVDGYDPILSLPYSSWAREEQTLYLSRKHDYPGPP